MYPKIGFPKTLTNKSSTETKLQKAMQFFKEFQTQSDRLTSIMCELPQMADSRWDRDMRGDIRNRWPSLTVWAGFFSEQEFQKLWLSLKIVNSCFNLIFLPPRLDLSRGQNWGFLASDLISGLGKREQAMQWGRECFTAGGHFSVLFPWASFLPGL